MKRPKTMECQDDGGSKVTRQRSALRPWLVVAFVVLALGAIIAASCSSSNQGAASSTTAATAGASTTVDTAASSTAAGVSTTAGGSSTTASADQGTPVLQVTTPSGTKSFTLAELKAMPAVEESGGILNSAGTITPPAKYKGVAVMDVIKAAGGLPAGTGVSFIAKDGYEMTMTADQVENGKFTTYDVSTGDEITIQDPIKLVLAYEKEGVPLDPDSEGTIRLVILSPQANQITDGHWWVKWVTKVDVKTMAVAWTLALNGAISDKVDRGTFDSCSAPNCHGVTWKDAEGTVWSGVPLYNLVGRVDGQTKHGNGAFDSALAAKGYQIQIVGNNGTTIALDSSTIALSKEYIVAYKSGGKELSGKDAPLRLVGPAVKMDQSVGGIKEIRLLIK